MGIFSGNGDSKWSASENAYRNNQRYNTNKALNAYGQDIADYINNYYNENPNNLGYGKYYFRGANGENEYNKIINDLTNKRLVKCLSFTILLIIKIQSKLSRYLTY